jgi:hypothetical protein
LVALGNVAAKAKKTLLLAKLSSETGKESSLSVLALHRRPVIPRKPRNSSGKSATEEEMLDQVPD